MNMTKRIMIGAFVLLANVNYTPVQAENRPGVSADSLQTFGNIHTDKEITSDALDTQRQFRGSGLPPTSEGAGRKLKMVDKSAPKNSNSSAGDYSEDPQNSLNSMEKSFDRNKAMLDKSPPMSVRR